MRFRVGVFAALLLQGALLGSITPTLWRHAGIELGAPGFDVSLATGAPRVSKLDPDGPAIGLLELDDEILALDGVALAEQLALRYDTVSPGARYELRVKRRGETRVLSLVAPAVWSEEALIRVWGQYGVAWAILALAGLMGLGRSTDSVARLGCIAFLLCGVAGFNDALTGLDQGLLDPRLRLLRAITILSPVQLAAAYHFAYRFPRSPPGLAWSRLLSVLYALAVPVATIRMLNGVLWNGIYSGPEGIRRWARWSPAFDAAARMDWLLIAAASAAILLVLARNYRHVEAPVERRKLRWAMLGSVLALIPMIAVHVWWVLWSFGFPRPGLWATSLANVGPILAPAGFAYATLRHGLFDIRVVVRRGLKALLAKRLLQLFLLAPIAALAALLALQRARPLGELLATHHALLLVAAVAGLALRFRAPLEQRIDRRFFREAYDRERLLLDVLAALRSNPAPREAAALLGHRVQAALQPSELRVLLRQAGPGGSFMQSYGSAPPVAVALTESDVLAATAGSATIQPVSLATPAGGLVVPAAAPDGRVLVALLLGPKLSEEPYSPSDRRLLDGVAQQLADCCARAELEQRLDRQQQREVAVLARLDNSDSVLMECPTCGICGGPGERCREHGVALEPALPVPRLLAGRYRLDRALGRGGMGAVYEAADLTLRRPVAVKLMVDAMRRADARRFEREARLASRLTHPSLCVVHDLGTTDSGVAYIVMERLFGLTLRQELHRRGVLSPADAALWFGQLLDGLQVAHTAGIVHRDIKPPNVMLVDEGRQAKLLDFGLAKTAADGESSLTTPGSVVGTLAYMSPEQLLDHPVGPRSDLFSLAVMLVECLSGRHPFAADSGERLIANILTEPADLAGLPAVLTPMLEAGLRKRPEERVASAAGLKASMIPALEACPTLSPRPGAVGPDDPTTATPRTITRPTDP